MPDWTASFHTPRMTDAEYEKKKAEYVAKYGYQITIPGFEDIVHLPIEKPMTLEEDRLWKAKKFDLFSPERYEELKYIKKRRKERYLARLGSPTPEFLRTRASWLGSLDDAEDAMSTLACLGMVATRVLPKWAADAVAGPTGWLMVAADILDLATLIIVPEQLPLNRKRAQDKLTESNPASKKARAKRAKKLRDCKLNHGDLIEALQVCDNVFGVGLSLGALMGAPLQIIAGNVRWITGAPVKVKYPVPDMSHWVRAGKKLASAAWDSMTTPFGTDDNQVTRHLVGLNIAAQLEHTHLSDWNPLDGITFPSAVETHAKIPTSTFAREILEEEDPEGLTKIGHPSTGQRWSTYNDLLAAGKDIANDNFKRYCERNRHNFMGFAGAINATESLFYNVEALEGEGSMEYDYTAMCKTTHSLLSQGYRFPAKLTRTQKQAFLTWITEHESIGTCPTTPEVLSYAKEACGFEFEQPAG